MSTQPNTTDSTSQSAGKVPSIIAFSSSSSIVIDALWSLWTQSVSAIRSGKISSRYTHGEEIKQIHMLKDLLNAIKDMYDKTPLKRTPEKTPTFNTNASQVTASPHRSDYCSSSEVSNHIIIISLNLFTC